MGVVIPAYDEEASIGTVVTSVLQVLGDDGKPLVDHVVVCSNASTDNTADVARSAGAEVVEEPKPGYGKACLTALSSLLRHDPDYMVFIDGDNAFEAGDIPRFLSEHEVGADLVIGSRSLGHAENKALTITQRFGNQLASALIWLLWRKKVSDLGPYRSITRQAYNRLHMQDEAFGWTVEMQIKAIQQNMRISEIPVNTKVRIGRSKISGTLQGILGAGFGIISKIITLRLNQ